jgi:hypothetical protein
MENFTKYPNFYPNIRWEDLRNQESLPVAGILDRFEEGRWEAYLNGEYDEHGPEIDNEGYIISHWTDTWKIPKNTEPIDCPF